MSMKKDSSNRTVIIVMTALFAALMAVCSWIAIPLPGLQVPVTLGTLGATLAGGILGWQAGSLAILVFLLLGACGLPVFAGFHGGIGALAGPTGGYLIGYILLAFFTGLLIQVLCKKKLNVWGIAAATIVGEFFCYLLGTAWYVISMHVTPIAALSLCVFPFLPGDALKIVCSTLLIRRLRPVAENMGITPVHTDR